MSKSLKRLILKSSDFSTRVGFGKEVVGLTAGGGDEEEGIGSERTRV